MLQFDKSINTNSNAIYPTVTASIGTTSVVLDFTQTYDKSKTENVVATLLNIVGPANEWLIFQITGSDVPAPTGQYDVDIYEYIQTSLGTWGTQATLWSQTSLEWDGDGGSIQKTVLLSSDRAWVSGSNGYEITQYLSPVDGGTYTTYNYPA